ncbi:MAG: hypothetical protein MJ170_00095 [Alphaproteobacteria bacterium]|nr:hypothetical protein [Alphaproteobacteria bacterium]
MNKFLPIIMSGILALPTLGFAASSVRTLGGAGTYNGVTSVGSGTATRAGSVRAVPAVKVSKTTTSATTSPSTSGSTGTVSGNAGTGTRMSIGKYLSGSGVVSNKVSTSTSTAGAINLPEFEAKVEEKFELLKQDIADLKLSDETTAEALESLESLLADIDDWATKQQLIDDYITEDEIDEIYLRKDKLREELDKSLATTPLAGYALSSDIPDMSDFVTSDNIADIIAGAVELGEIELSGYAKTTDLGGYLKSSEFDSKFTDAFNKSSGVTVINDTIDEISGKIDELNTKITDVADFSVYDGAFDPDKLDVE